MQKKTKNVIATVLALIGRPSEQRLSRKDLRLLVHNAVEKYSARAIKEREDWWTHIDDVTVAYSASNNYYTFTLPSSIAEYKPLRVWYQPTTSNRDVDDWFDATVVPLESFPDESRLSGVVISFYGNNFDGIGGLRAISNMTEAYAGSLRFRMQYRRLSATAPSLTGTVPFPFEYITLIEYSVAEEALSLIVDDSAEFTSFFTKRLPIISQRIAELEMDFMDAIKREPLSRTIRAIPYNYKRNNRRGRTSLRVEP